MQEKRRIYYWDNFKTLLILLVIIGHMMIPMKFNGNERQLQTFFYSIYIFHMPAFVFVTGFFSKSYIKQGVIDVNRLIGIMILYLLFSGLLYVIHIGLSDLRSLPLFFSDGSAQWYLLAMFNWFLILPVFASVKVNKALLITLILGLYIGTEKAAGSFWALSRTIVMLPFFLAGFYFKKEAFLKIRKPLRIFAAAFLIVILLLLYKHLYVIKPYLSIIYADKSYEMCGYSLLQGAIIRAFWYLAASVITASVMCLIPTGQHWFTYIGSRTLGIYIWHKVVREIIDALGFFDNCASLSDEVKFLIVIVLSFLLMIIFSLKCMSLPFERIMRYKYLKNDKTISI